MTAAELASFRTLLQAQATPPPRPDHGLFASMRARLTVVERSAPPADAPAPTRREPFAPPRLACVSWDEPDADAADPPPSIPPVFGRREGAPPDAERGAAPPPPLQNVVRPEPELAAVRLQRATVVEEAHGTPEDPCAGRGPPCGSTPSPGRIAGWSQARPARAQHRLLQRLEAVFLAEREGLEARIAADAPAG